MKYLLSFAMLLVFFLALFTSCEKIKSYPATPQITYESFYARDTLLNDNKARAGTLVFKFVDGDGDFGLYTPDSLEKDTAKLYNLYFKFYQKVNGEFVQDTSLKTKVNYPIYYSDKMNRDGQVKTLKGTVAIIFEYFLVKYDTIKYDFYIVDRALNKSNVVTTPELEIRPETVNK